MPIGFKINAQHIESDVHFAVDAGAVHIILDGRGGGTGDAPLMFRDHIPELRKRLKVEPTALRLAARFLGASVQLMQMARACGHDHLNQFNCDDLTITPTLL